MTNKPAGINIIVFLYLLISIIGVIAALNRQLEWFTLAINSVFIIAAIGLLMRQQWAWWIICVFTMISIIMQLSALYLGLSNHEVISGTNKIYLKHGGKLIIQLLILSFMVSKNVTEYYQLKRFNTWQKLGIILIAALVSIGALALFAEYL